MIFDLGTAFNLSSLSLAAKLNYIYFDYIRTIIIPLLTIFSNYGLLNAYPFSSN